MSRFLGREAKQSAERRAMQTALQRLAEAVGSVVLPAGPVSISLWLLKTSIRANDP